MQKSNRHVTNDKGDFIYYWHKREGWTLTWPKTSGLEPLLGHLASQDPRTPTPGQIYAALDVWRQHVGYIYEISSPDRKVEMLEEVREDWNEVRRIQRQIDDLTEMAKQELERRG